MGCIEHKKSPAADGNGHDFNAFEEMEPRLPGKTPVDRRNGKHVKANDIPPEGVYLPNNNYLAPHMKSPEYVQLSNAAAITLGIEEMETVTTRQLGLVHGLVRLSQQHVSVDTVVLWKKRDTDAR